jgi:hypothetical protein
MANATEVARARAQILGERDPSNAVAEERAIAQADAGIRVFGIENIMTLAVDHLTAAAGVYVYIAPVKCRVVKIQEVHSVVGGASAAVRPRKVTADAVAPAAVAGATVLELTTAAIDVTNTVNTVQTPTLSATETDLILAVGDRIALNFTGTMTAAVGRTMISLAAMP